MNIYKITYYSYDAEDQCYCAEFYKMFTSNKDEEQMQHMMDMWNLELVNKKIPGRVCCSSIELSSLEDYTIHDLIRDLYDL